jgi:hypothetical protein
MCHFLFALIPLLATQPTAAALPEARTVRIDVVIYTGNPDAKAREVMSSPTLLTRDRQRAVVAIGQTIPMNLTEAENGVQPVKLEFAQTGLFVDIIPTLRNDGRISLRSAISMTELIANTAERTQTKETKTQCNTVCKPGEKVTVLLYNPNDYRDTVDTVIWPGIHLAYPIKKPYTGRECWVELVAREYDMKTETPPFPFPEAVPVGPMPGSIYPRAILPARYGSEPTDRGPWA